MLDGRSLNRSRVLSHANQSNPNTPIKNEVILRSSKDEAEFMHGSATYGEWREQWKPILQFRGPKW